MIGKDSKMDKMIDEPIRPGSYVRNPKEPYMGLCIVLEVDGHKVRTYSERGPYDVLATLAQLIEVSPEDSIFPGAGERLRRAFEQAQQRKLSVDYSRCMQKATDAMRKAAYPFAAEQFMKALTLEPNSEEALAGRADCWRLTRAYAKAVEDYTSLIRNGSASHETYLNRALSYEALGKLGDAVEDAQKALEINPCMAQACEALARFHRKLVAHHEELALQYELQARQIKNPSGNLGPLFD